VRFPFSGAAPLMSSLRAGGRQAQNGEALNGGSEAFADPEASSDHSPVQGRGAHGHGHHLQHNDSDAEY